MGTKITIFGNIKLLKRNPWLSGKLASIVKSGLARVKKEFILADPPPWFGDPSKLSEAQIYQVLRFSKVAHETRGQSMSYRIKRIKTEASGPTPYPKKPKTYVMKIGKIITIAKARGISIPPELERIPAPTPAPEVAVIRE